MRDSRSVSAMSEGDGNDIVDLFGSFEDGIEPNCPKCLERMEARVGAWWCESCEVAVSPGQ